MRFVSILFALLLAGSAGAQTVTQGNGQSPKYVPWTVQGPPPGATANPLKVQTADYQRAAFGAVAVAAEQVEIHLQFPYAINPRIVTVTPLVAGTATVSNGMLLLTAPANDSVILFSNSAVKYTPGQGVIARFTAVNLCNSQTTEVGAGIKRAGVGAPLGQSMQDAFYFGCDQNGVHVGIEANPSFSVNLQARQADWNVDRMDGTGPSKQKIDFSQGNVYMIDYQWLGFGAIRFFIENPTTGEPQLVHVFRYANAHTTPSIGNPALRLFAFCASQDATVRTLRIGSMGAAIQGPRNDFGVNNAFIASKACTAAGTPANVFTLQNRATFNGVTNRTRLKVTSLTATCSGANGIVRVILNGTEAGAPSFTNLNTTQSIAATDVAGTTVTGGNMIFPLAVGTNSTAQANVGDSNFRLDPGDTLNFTCEPATATCTIGASWREEF